MALSWSLEDSAQACGLFLRVLVVPGEVHLAAILNRDGIHLLKSGSLTGKRPCPHLLSDLSQRIWSFSDCTYGVWFGVGLGGLLYVLFWPLKELWFPSLNEGIGSCQLPLSPILEA